MNILKIIKTKYYRSRFYPDAKRIDYLRSLGIQIGNNCEVFTSVDFGSEPYLISLGNYVKISNGVRFVTHDGGVFVLRNMGLLPNADIFGRITIHNNVFIGNYATIMPGVEIGENSIVGMGSIVTKDIPANSVAAGVPARVIRSTQSYYEKYKDNVDFTKNLTYEEKKNYLYKKYHL